MKRATSRYLSLLLIVAALAGCASGPRLYSTQNPESDFSSFMTFSYMEQLGTDPQGGPRTLLSRFLTTAVDREMQARGYTRVADGADVLVNFYVETQEQIQTRQRPASGVNVGYGYYGYRGGYYGTWGGYTETEVTQYTEGTLNIDLVDAARNELIWEGVAIGRITEEALQNVQAAVDSVVPQIFSQYPVAAAQ
ncbi:MAG: DUF4136 domain-containing protein [Gammaproteobacteria bacterium]